jgi:large subunit ribosomal protein L7/L12
MSTTVEQIIDQLKTLTLIESSELVTQIEQTFVLMHLLGRRCYAYNGSKWWRRGSCKTTFDVMVEAIVSDKRSCIKSGKLTSLGLAEAEFTTSLPKALKEGVSKDEAEETKKR